MSKTEKYVCTFYVPKWFTKLPIDHVWFSETWQRELTKLNSYYAYYMKDKYTTQLVDMRKEYRDVSYEILEWQLLEDFESVNFTD